MKTKKFLSIAALIALSIFAASCSSEEPVQDPTDGGEEYTIFSADAGTADSGNDAETGASAARVTLEEQGVSADKLTRSSMSHTVGGTGTFSWENGDYVWINNVKSDVVSSKVASYNFKVTGTFTEANYDAFYTGTSGKATSVTIATAQTASGFNNTAHFGKSGDCAYAKATKQSNGTYSLNFAHKAAYLCLLPYATNTTDSKKYKIKSVKVTSTGNLAGTYTLSSTGLSASPTTGANKSITLTVGNGQGVALANQNVTAKNIANSLYMVVAPGTHTLTLTCTVFDTSTNKDATITTSFSSKSLDPGKVYDAPFKLEVPYNLATQSDTSGGLGPRWGWGCPFYWFTRYGDPYWDANKKWTVTIPAHIGQYAGGGYFYVQEKTISGTGGVWLKKLGVIFNEKKTAIEAELPGITQEGVECLYKYASSKYFTNNKYTNSVKTGNPNNSNYFFVPVVEADTNGEVIPGTTKTVLFKGGSAGSPTTTNSLQVTSSQIVYTSGGSEGVDAGSNFNWFQQ